MKFSSKTYLQSNVDLFIDVDGINGRGKQMGEAFVLQTVDFVLQKNIGRSWSRVNLRKGRKVPDERS